MSSDVQPRKRKEKKRRRDDEDTPKVVHGAATPQPQQKASRSASVEDVELLHVQHDHGTGGHWCAKIFFFSLMAILIGLVGLIVLENRGQSDLDTPLSESRFADYLEGWVDEVRVDEHHDDHSVLESLHELDDHGHDDEPFSEEEVPEDEDEEHGDDDDDHDDHDEHDDENGDSHAEEDDDDEHDDGDEQEEGDGDEEASEEPEAEASDEAVASEANDDDDDDDNVTAEAQSVEADDDDDNDSAAAADDGDDDDDDDDKNGTNEEEGASDAADDDNDNDGEKDDSVPESTEASNAAASDNGDDDDDSDPFDENSQLAKTPSELKDQVDDMVERFNRLARSLELDPLNESKSIPDVTKEDDDEQSLEEEQVIDNDVGEDLHLQKLAHQDEATAEADSADEQPAEQSSLAVKAGVGLALIVVGYIVLAKRAQTTVGGDDEETADATASADEAPVQSTQRRMTLIAHNAAGDHESEHDDEEGYDEDELLAEDYDDDDNDDYERYSDEEELELQQHADELHAEEAAASKPHSFEPIQPVAVVNEYRSPPIQHSDSVEKRQAVTFAAEPPVPILIEKEPEVSDEIEYDDDEEVGEEEEDEDEIEYDEEYEDEDLDEEEYDEEAEEEEEDHEDVSDIDDADLMQRLESKYGKLDATVEQSDEDSEVAPPRATVTTKTATGGAQSYSADLEEELRQANELLDDRPTAALKQFNALLERSPMAAQYGRARALDRLAAKRQDNDLLEQAIAAYAGLVTDFEPVLSDEQLLAYGTRCVELMRFKGQNLKAIPIHELLIARFNSTADQRNQLAITYLLANRMADAKLVLHETLLRWRDDGFAVAHYGFILKAHDNDLPQAVRFLREGIDSGAAGTDDGRLYGALGDALQRLQLADEARDVFRRAAKLGLFRSEYQRSLYNVERLKAKPIWLPDETGAAAQFAVLAQNWRTIRAEAEKLLTAEGDQFFRPETEMLRDSGDWRQFELFARGRRLAENCARAPLTCKIIEGMAAARTCTRGQVKFSVMQPGTHVWPHCGPTNCRLRAHLGLQVPRKTFLRVANRWRTWREGEWLIFDDSFEHEVWHNGTAVRLVLIVDIWHPELTEHERKTLPPI